MAGTIPFIAQADTTDSSGTSKSVQVDALDDGPVAAIYISSAATVNVQHSFTPTVSASFRTILTVTASDSIELDPRGGNFRFTWSGNNGTVSVTVGPGRTNAQGLVNVTEPSARSQAPS